MHFRLTYVTDAFVFGDAEISASEPDKNITVVVRRRPNNGGLPAFEPTDGLIVALCERTLSDRLHNEATNSGILSLEKGAVKKAYDDMNDCIQRTLRLVRWRGHARGRPNPIRSAVPNYFVWSVDGLEWKMVADCVSITIKFLYSSRPWFKEDAEFLQTELVRGSSEPLGHELLREADVNRESNPRSSLVLAVAAAEVGFKQFVSRAFPDVAWLMELPSPPLTVMLNQLPWEQLKLRINDKVPAVPEPIIDELKKAVTLRNKIVHSGVANLSSETLDSILNTVSDFLYFLDALHGSGQLWALNLVNQSVIGHFKKE
jgi:hypothetical protein